MCKLLAIALVAFSIAGCQKAQAADQSTEKGNAIANKSSQTGDAALKSIYGNIKTNSLRTADQSTEKGNATANRPSQTGDASLKSMYGNIKTNSLR